MTKINNTPNASKTLNSLRFLDYNPETAGTDICDNSVDAKASSVHIWIVEDEKNKIIQIDIADNGIGMDKDTITQAMKLGSDTDKNENFELGKFGMGLITASISLGKRLEVVSLNNNYNKFVRAVQDLDEIEESNEFEVNISEHSIEEYNSYCHIMKNPNPDLNSNPNRKEDTDRREINQGTVISIKKIDKMTWTRADKFADKLRKVIGQTYRKFIKGAGPQFYIHVTKEQDLVKRIKSKIDFDKARVKAVDPIHDFEPTLLNKAEINTSSGSINLSVYKLKNYGKEINRNKYINIPNQGFYILRNKREIMSGASLGLFTKHNNYNLLRCELEITGETDVLAGINFSKQKASLNQSLSQQIDVEFQPFLKQVGNESRNRQNASNDQKTDFSDVEKQITKKSHLLNPIKSEVEKRFSKEDRDKVIEKERKKIETNGPRLNISKRKKVGIDALKVRFEKIKGGGVKGPLYEADMERNVVIVKWNEDHPFYTDVIAPNSNKPDIFNPLAYLIYCNAKAELVASHESDSLQIIEDIRWVVGRDLATLISS
tara:strand:- start:2330 stop:3967 length:1638 start_codon:yes stop_codon:yes gene_type:complete